MKNSALQLAKQIVSDSKEYIDGNISEYMLNEVGANAESFFEYLTEEEITLAESDTHEWNRLSNEVTAMLIENLNYDIYEFKY